MPVHSAPLVESVRAASRHLVRELGFTGRTFAGTDLSPSAVHALIEIEPGGVTSRDIGESLRLEKSSVSRLLRRLVESGEVEERTAPLDGRVKHLFLTAAGRQRVAAIHAFAQAQVAGALARLAPGQERIVLDGLRLYAQALGTEGAATPAPHIGIALGYRPGLLARITQMHALHYARTAGFGLPFERLVSSGLAEFGDRLERPGNAIWSASRGDNHEVVGSIAIDGEDLGGNVAHLRWFIVDDAAQGAGAGRRLLAAALAFVDGQQAFAATHLWTFKGLDAARHLYESNGFALAEERSGTRWGGEVLEQRFVRPRP